MQNRRQNRDNVYSTRKTSAQIVKEAQKSLTTSSNSNVGSSSSKKFSGSSGQFKLVSTRRPITPAVNFEKRQLYSRDSNHVQIDRPPSAINLKHLQNEARALPVLEPIKSDLESPVRERTIQRSESLGSFQVSKFVATLPSLSENGKIQTSQSSENLCQQQPRTIAPPKEKKEKASRKQIESLLTSDQLLRSNYLLTQSSTEKLIELLYQFRGFNADKSDEKTSCFTETQDHLCMILRELYSRIKKIQQTSRSPLLVAIYGLVECNSSKVLLLIAQIVLGMGVGGSNLTGAFKLIFKIAKNDSNDALFVDTDLPELMVDALGKISPLNDGEPEAAIYSYGAIRFLAMSGTYMVSNGSSNNCKISKQKHIPYRLIKHGIIQLMILHIQIFNEYGSVNEIDGQSLHALYQLLASFRVLLGLPILGYFVKTRNTNVKCLAGEKDELHLEVSGKHLIKTAFICIKDLYIQANVIRTLSVLSDIEICCASLSHEVVKLGQMIGLFKLEDCLAVAKQKSLGLISRLGYTIGNVMERFDEARLDFFRRNDLVLRYVLELIHFFSKQAYDIQTSNGDTVADVLIKYVRIIANISVNNEVGYFLNSKPLLGEALLNILNNVHGENHIKECDELLIATLAALHNLTYYLESSSEQRVNVSRKQQGCLYEKLKEICEVLCVKYLPKQVKTLEKVEVIRVLGNITKDISARETFYQSDGIKNVMKCMGEDDKETLENSCGVLVNVLNDNNSRSSFQSLSGMFLLRECLKRGINENNWFLGETVCKAFWNFLIDKNDSIQAPDAEEIDALANDLAEYLDEESFFETNQPPQEWEDFASVASDLLEYLQSSVQVNENERSVE